MRAFLLLYTICLLFTVPVSAQEVWGLEKCVNHALENNLNVRQAETAVNFADVNLRQAKHARLPSLNASSGLNWNFGKTVDPTSNDFITQTFFANTIGLNTGVVLYNGGRINKTISQGKVEREAAQLDLKQMRNDISLQVTATYINVLFADENIRIAESQMNLTEQQLEQLEKLITAGMNPENDRLNLEAQLLQSEQNLVIAVNTRDISLLNLKQLLQLDPDKEIDVEYPARDIPVTTDPDEISFNGVYERALETQTSIQASELRLKSAEIAMDIARSSYYPSLFFGANVGTNYSNRGVSLDGTEIERIEQEFFINNEPVTVGIDQVVPIFVDSKYDQQLEDNISYGFGFNLSIPIYNNYNTKASVQRAELSSMNAYYNDEITKNTLKTNVQTALTNARSAKRTLEAANKTQAAQQAAFDNAQKRYDLGSINTFEYISARNQLDTAIINALIAKYDYVFKSKVLDYYLGLPITLNN